MLVLDNATLNVWRKGWGWPGWGCSATAGIGMPGLRTSMGMPGYAGRRGKRMC